MLNDNEKRVLARGSNQTVHIERGTAQKHAASAAAAAAVTL